MVMKRLGFALVMAVVLGIMFLGLSGITSGPALGWPGEPTPDEIIVRTPASPPETPTAVAVSPDSSSPSTTEVIVDDLDPGFQRYGPSAGWYHSGSSDTTYNGHAYWTYCTDTWQSPSVNNWATWTPNLPASGQWEVFAYVPYVNTGRYDTGRARYQIHTASGDYVVERDQNNNTGWVSLGTYTFSAGTGGYVRLEDVTPDWYFTYGGQRYRKTIKFDAIKWVFQSGEGTELPVQWKASAIRSDCQGPYDGQHWWYEIAFDDSSWQSINLPDESSIPQNSDRFYRGFFYTSSEVDVQLKFWSNDGLSLYLDGQPVGAGHWGPGCHGEGCVNGGGGGCAYNTNVGPQNAHLRAGNHWLAAHVSNGPPGSYFKLIVLGSTPSPTYSISGRVTDDVGTAVANATVSATGPTNTSTTTGSDGRYTLSNLLAGTYSVSASKAGHTSPAARTVTVPPNATNVDFVLQRQTYSISGRVTDDTGAGVAAATVSATGPTNASTTTGSDGRYTLSNLLAGTYSVSASKASYTSPPAQSVTVPPNATNVDFILQLACSANEWRGEYYNNRNLQGPPVLVRCDRSIDFYWGTRSPDSRIPAGNFSIRWTQNINLPEEACYRFRTFASGQLHLFMYSVPQITDASDRIPFAEKSKVLCLPRGYHYTSVQYYSPQGQENEAMAHVTWYQCPNGQGDCSMNITPQYQTQYSNSSDPDQQMPKGCPSKTIADVGCLITSYAMALQPVLQQLGMATNPKELNRWLSENGGYSDGWCEAYLRDSFIGKFVAWKTNGAIRGLNWVDVSSPDDAKTAIRARHPVIVHKRGGDDGHWFLAVDIANVEGYETLGINDPIHKWGSQPGRTLDHRTSLRDYSTASLRFYIEPISFPSPSLEFLVRGAELLLTDAQGRRVGYNPATGQIIREIPNSFYYDSKIIPPGGQSDGIIERNLFLPNGAGGNYVVKVIGASAAASINASGAASDFIIDIVGFDSQFNLAEATISGAVQPGSITTFDVTFSPGQEIRVTPHCPGDANGDNVVNAVDLSILASEWGRNCGQQPCRADFNQDGIVNAVDLSILAANWGRRCS